LSKSLMVKQYKEFKGYGTSGYIGLHLVKIGSAEFILGKKVYLASSGSKVFLSIDDEFIGYFIVQNAYRKGLSEIIPCLKQKFELKILSGDNSSEESYLKTLFGINAQMSFEQKPEDKLQFVKQLQSQEKKVLMVGDGLNDAGALKQSDVGIAVNDNTNNFSPASDVILSGKSFGLLNELILYCQKQKRVIYTSFIVSILYNLVGLFFAIQGNLQPVIAAILMPISSISIVLLTTGMSAFYSRKLKKRFMIKVRDHAD